MYCLNPMNGQMVWKNKTDSSIMSNPLIIDDLLVFHSRNTLYCMDKKSCDVRWNKRMSAGLFNTVVYYDRKIITGCEEGYLYCINIEDGKTAWELNVEKSIFDSATVWNNNVYFGRQDGMFYCVNAKDGKIIWCYKAGSGTTAPAICDNKVFFRWMDQKPLLP